MYINKTFFILLICSLLALSCTKDEQLYPLPLTEKCLLIKDTNDEGYFDTYEYDQENRLTSYVGTSTSTEPGSHKEFYYYDDYNRISKILTYEHSAKGIGKLEITTLVAYEDNKPFTDKDVLYGWSSFVQTFEDSKQTWQVKAFYDEQGRRTKVEYLRDDVVESIQHFSYQDQNIKEATFMGKGYFHQEHYEYYLDKPNSLARYAQLVTMGDGGGEPYSVDLLKKVVSTQDPSATFTYEYTFNRTGYPLTITGKDNQGVASGKHTMEYTCKGQ